MADVQIGILPFSFLFFSAITHTWTLPPECTLIISALRWRQKDQLLKANLDYIVPRV